MMLVSGAPLPVASCHVCCARHPSCRLSPVAHHPGIVYRYRHQNVWQLPCCNASLAAPGVVGAQSAAISCFMAPEFPPGAWCLLSRPSQDIYRAYRAVLAVVKARLSLYMLILIDEGANFNLRIFLIS